MSAKLDKLKEELEKARKKKSQWDARVKALEAQYQEAEKTEINSIVQSYNVTPEQLKEMLQTFSNDLKPHPAETHNTDKEETHNET